MDKEKAIQIAQMYEFFGIFKCLWTKGPHTKLVHTKFTITRPHAEMEINFCSSNVSLTIWLISLHFHIKTSKIV